MSQFNRPEDFSLKRLNFSWADVKSGHAAWNQMAIFEFRRHSPDPMAMYVVAEAWARRMIQTEDPVLADSFCMEAIEFSTTPITRRRIENIREIY